MRCRPLRCGVMKRVLSSPWLVALVVLALAVLPVVAALQAHREQARRASALLLDRSAEVVAAHLQLLTVRQTGWQNALRMRLSNRPDAPVEVLDTLFASGSTMVLPEHCRALGYAALEDGRVVMRWRRVKKDVTISALGEDLVPATETGSLLRAVREQPAKLAMEQHGARLLTALTVAENSPRNPRGCLIAWWDLDAMCADKQLGLVAISQTLTARPSDGVIGEGEREMKIGEGDAQWRLVVGKGTAFSTLFPHVSELTIAVTGGGCALLLALLAGLATRAAGLRAALTAERELVHMKDHLLHSVSHEFRTPLSVILSSTELLECYADRLPPERRSAALAQIRESTAWMNDMVGQVLLFARIDARRLPVEPCAVNVAAFARELVRATETATGKRNPIHLTAPEALEATLDPALLRAVLENLLSNAVKFSPEGVPVLFTVERGERLRFVIRDTGPGIAAGELSRVRQPFFRAAAASGTPGTGLGLTIADRCATLLGGVLTIKSGPGGGTIATFTL